MRRAIPSNAYPLMDPLKRLQDWYISQCDGDWEHTYGISIATRAFDSMLAAAAILIVDGIVAIEDRHRMAVGCLERPQSLLIGYSRTAVHVGLALKETQNQRHPVI